MIPRPHFRLPIWAALAIALAAYLVRAYLWRGGSLAPDLPADAVAFGVLIVALFLVRRARSLPPDDPDGDPDD